MKDVFVLYCDGVAAVVNENEFSLIEKAIREDVVVRLDGRNDEIEVTESPDDATVFHVTYMDDSETVWSETYELISATFYK